MTVVTPPSYRGHQLSFPHETQTQGSEPPFTYCCVPQCLQRTVKGFVAPPAFELPYRRLVIATLITVSGQNSHGRSA